MYFIIRLTGFASDGLLYGATNDIYNTTTATLRCKTTGFPKPTILWYKVPFHYGSGETLSIPITGDFSGLFTCVAKNSEGTVDEHIDVNIIDPLKIKPYQKDYNLTEFKSFDLECPVTGQLDNVVWLMVRISILNFLFQLLST